MLVVLGVPCVIPGLGVLAVLGDIGVLLVLDVLDVYVSSFLVCLVCSV